MKYVDEINVSHGGENTRMFSTAGTKFKKLCIQNKLKLLDAFQSVIWERISTMSFWKIRTTN